MLPSATSTYPQGPHYPAAAACKLQAAIATQSRAGHEQPQWAGQKTAAFKCHVLAVHRDEELLELLLNWV